MLSLKRCIGWQEGTLKYTHIHICRTLRSRVLTEKNAQNLYIEAFELYQKKPVPLFWAKESVLTTKRQDTKRK